MTKFVNTIVDFFSTYQSGSAYKELENITTFTLPDTEFEDGELTGAGIIGTVNIPDMFNIGELELSITGKSYSSMKPLFNKSVSLRLNWAEEVAGANGDSSFDSYTVIAKGRPKKIPGGEITKGEQKELESTLSCTYYKLIQNGATIFEINKLTGVLVINGVNLAKELNKALNK